MPVPAPDLSPGPDLLGGLAVPFVAPAPEETVAVAVASSQPAGGIPHLAFPLRFVDGLAVTVEQDSPDHMLDRVHVTCRTMLGERLDDPTFGIPSDLLRVNRADLDQLAAAIASSEPDIAVTVSRPSPAQPEPPGFRLPGSRDDIRITVEESG